MEVPRVHTSEVRANRRHVAALGERVHAAWSSVNNAATCEAEEAMSAHRNAEDRKRSSHEAMGLAAEARHGPSALQPTAVPAHPPTRRPAIDDELYVDVPCTD
jgi:hypothetical protein